MQSERKADLVKRSRYYQAHLDTSLLEPGVPSYNLLNDTYIIFITPFDPFGYGKYRYTFRPFCEEVSDCRLEDGATRIFLNTRGTNDGEVSEELVEFLHYLEDTSDEKAAASKSERIRHIHERVRKVKGNEEIGMKYLAMLEEKYYAKQEGLEEGREVGRAEGELLRLILLIRKKLQRGKSLEESADDLEMESGELEPVYNLVRDHAEKTDEEILELL